MKKILTISITLLTILFFGMPFAIPAGESPDDEFASLMEELFGPKPGAEKKEASKQKSPFVPKKLSPIEKGIRPVVKPGSEEKSEEKKPSAKEVADKIMSALILFQKSLTNVTNALKSDLFDPDFRENISHHITAQASLKEPTGPIWTSILISELRNPKVIQIEKARARKVYREVLTSNKDLLPSVEKASLKLSDLQDELFQLRKLKKRSGLSLKQLRLPKAKRDPVKLKKQKEFDKKKKQVQQELNNFYETVVGLTLPGAPAPTGSGVLSSVTQKLLKVVTDPKVKQAVEK